MQTFMVMVTDETGTVVDSVEVEADNPREAIQVAADMIGEGVA